tara:strand:- start:1344 stop:1679 length:336 start_codon:yes stop_codon:yes gene_type:complete
MSWQDILKQGQLIDHGGEKWPPELIGFYRPEQQTQQRRTIAIPTKDRISYYQSNEDYQEIKLTFVSIGQREDTADYSYGENMGQIIVHKLKAMHNYLGEDYDWRTGEKRGW